MRKLANLKKLSDVDVKFHNTFVGETRFLELSMGEGKYFLTLQDKVDNLQPKAVFKFTIDGNDAYFLTKNYPVVENFNKDFQGVDLVLLPDVVRVEVAKLAYNSIINDITSSLKINFEIKEILFDENFAADSEKVVGLSVCDANGQTVVLGNIALSGALLLKLIDAFKKIPAMKTDSEHNVDFSVFLEAGRTSLSRDEYESLEENDIIFLDDASHISSGVFNLCGIEPIKASGSFRNEQFVLKNVLR